MVIEVDQAEVPLGSLEDWNGWMMTETSLIEEITDKDGTSIPNKKYEKILELVYMAALKKTNDENKADKITDYVANYSGQNLIGILNSDPKNKDNLTELLTEKPTNPFTFAIGGNIISRGITFNNLLSMFFTRNVKGAMQQDTYIQRARMFGNRSDKDMKHFELTIPADLYNNWHTCFLLHRISYLSAKSNMHPNWATGMGIKAVAPSSIDKSQVNIEKGEMNFNKIKYETGTIIIPPPTPNNPAIRPEKIPVNKNVTIKINN